MATQNGRTSAQRGIFRALLRFRVGAVDEKLHCHLDTANANAPCLSWQTQNEIINSFSTIIVQKLVEEVKQQNLTVFFWMIQQISQQESNVLFL